MFGFIQACEKFLCHMVNYLFAGFLGLYLNMQDPHFFEDDQPDPFSKHNEIVSDSFSNIFLL